MEKGIDLTTLLHKGGVYHIDGNTINSIYKNISNVLVLPESVRRTTLYKALYAREKLLGTAIGKGFSLPHSSYPLIKKKEDQRIFLCYLNNPIDMAAPDGRKVFAMFVLLTSERATHIKVLAAIAKVLQNETFTKLLEKKSNETELLTALNKII